MQLDKYSKYNDNKFKILNGTKIKDFLYNQDLLQSNKNLAGVEQIISKGLHLHLRNRKTTTLNNHLLTKI